MSREKLRKMIAYLPNDDKYKDIFVEFYKWCEYIYEAIPEAE